jgi:hypothetical protein
MAPIKRKFFQPQLITENQITAQTPNKSLYVLSYIYRRLRGLIQGVVSKK